jgi:hypothetical protein
MLVIGGLGEYFDPFTGRLLGANDQSWTAAVALDWLATQACGALRSTATLLQPGRLETIRNGTSDPLGIFLAFDAISPLASTEPPLVPGRASPPQLRLQTLDQQALFLKLLQKSVPLPPKDNDAPDLLGMLRYLP